MPLGSEIIQVAEMEFPQWEDIREKAKECIESVAPEASVYATFELEFDAETMLRKVSSLLKSKNDPEKYHSWMVGITKATLKKGSNGGQEFIGGFAFTWILTIEFEGYFDPNGERPIAVMEKEVQLITVMIFRNSDMLLEWAKFGEVEWSSLDKEVFADGTELLIAQGSSEVEVQISIPG